MNEIPPVPAPDLRGRTAVVTGAGRGIGRAVSLALAQAGARVVLAARTAAQIEAVAAEIARAGGRAVPVPADVADETSIAALFDRVRREFGGLDVLVNNAGIGRYGPTETFAAVDFDAVIATNLRGTFLCCREAVRMMKPRRSGVIVNVSSVVGIKGYPQQAAYTASKHGVTGLTKSLAAEVQKDGIRVCVVHPGGVDTELASQARPDLDRSLLLRPEDVAGAVMYLVTLSDRASVDEIHLRRRTGQPF